MEIIPIKGLPLIEEGDDLAEQILEAVREQGIGIEDHDVIVIAQSIVSKSEGNIVELEKVDPSPRAEEIGEKTNKDPRIVELILQETEEIIRMNEVIISETRHGFICANAGVDSSNAGPGKAIVLPDDPDESASELRRKLVKETGKKIAVIISDSWGRPFRFGAVGFAVGVAGIEPLEDLRGKEDAYGEELETTIIAPPDSLAAAASLQMGESNERIPAVLIKGAPYSSGDAPTSEMLRPPEEDLFR